MSVEIEDVNEDMSGQENNNGDISKEEQVKVENSVIEQLQQQIKELSEKVSQSSVPATTSGATDAGVLKDLVSAIKGSKEDSSSFVFENNYTSEAMIDEADVLPKDEWVTFISHTVGFVIVDDMVNGTAVRVPYGKIEFRYDSTKTIKNGKEQDVYNISKYTCKSKKELGFLKRHSGYRFFFFSNIKGARAIDATKAIKMQTIFKGLSGLGQVELVSLAKQYDISIPEDISLLRGEIAMKIVGDQILKEKSVTEQLLRETSLEAELISR